MPDVTIARLREVAGPGLYADNAFRLAGLPTTASRQDVLHRKQQLATMRQLGIDGSSEEANAAFDHILGDPRRRLVEELFWMWGDPGAGCECPLSVHRSHDMAVESHMAALELNGSGAALDVWRSAGKEWRRTLGDAGFWQHIRQRIVALDDRQLDESVIHELRVELPIVLIKPLVQLAVAAEDPFQLVNAMQDWPAPPGVIEDQLEAAAVPLYDTVEELTRQAADLVRARQPDAAANLLYTRVLPLVDRLSQLVPPNKHRRTAEARDRVAIVFNNCATALLDRNPATIDRTAPGWLGSALVLASDPQTVRTIKDNKATLSQAVQTLEMIRRRVDDFVRQGRPDVARMMLLDIKRQLGDTPGMGTIDRMLADLEGQPVTGGTRGRGCAVLALVVLGGFLLLYLLGVFR